MELLRLAVSAAGGALFPSSARSFALIVLPLPATTTLPVIEPEWISLRCAIGISSSVLFALHGEERGVLAARPSQLEVRPAQCQGAPAGTRPSCRWRH